MTQTSWKQYLINQASLHPSMEPQDVYKMMFQAAFGAEHILQAEEAAYTYLKKEFEEVMPEDELLYEQIADDVYRVNLRAWKKRQLPPEWLFKIFVGSVGCTDTVEKRGRNPESEWNTECGRNPESGWNTECGRNPESGRNTECGRNTESGRNILPESAHDRFLQYAEEAAEAVKEGKFSFSYEEFRKYTEEYNQTGPHAVHHSETYRKSERPAYRLVSGKYVRVFPVLEILADWQLKRARAESGAGNVENDVRSVEADTNEKPMIITIDGRCASGKSTMAKVLSEITGAGIVHMDDFFLPPKLRTEERLAVAGGNVHYERFKEEVLPFLKRKEVFSYRRFDCSRMELGEECVVADCSVRIVEGAYSNHPEFGGYADFKVFSDVEPEEQLKRIASRDGEDMLAMFKERWIPMEESYFEAYGIREKTDIVV